MRTTVLITVLTGAVLAAGCSGEHGAAVGPPAAVPSGPLSSAGVPYPGPLNLAGREPCPLVTPAQLAEFGLDRPLTPHTPNVGFTDARACGTRSTTQLVNTRWTLAPNDPVSQYTEHTKYIFEITKLPPIHGYPAYLARLPNHPEFCNAVVDTGPGQLLDVQFGDDGSARPTARADEFCAHATKVAGLVVGALLAGDR